MANKEQIFQTRKRTPPLPKSSRFSKQLVVLKKIACGSKKPKAEPAAETERPSVEQKKFAPIPFHHKSRSPASWVSIWSETTVEDKHANPTETQRKKERKIKPKIHPSHLRCIFDVSSILNNIPSKASWPNDCFGMGLLQPQRLVHMLCLLIFSSFPGWRKPTRILNFMERSIAPPRPS
ncbi:uncharacterized protein LOC111015434 isoform X2 [Momordica charantia]|uniref:Uncharacterized protein LOC111015434 isoform X2 n=1 Tax=Momordica charantia TaxID=3673 RepID=A0A6J1CXT4_MOMCH|nr:uncharacterized protein LOC111015434 isoform X2 [Momordica charantia]